MLVEKRMRTRSFDYSNILKNRELMLGLMVSLFFIIFAIFIENFFSFTNVKSMFTGATHEMFLASGILLVIITAGIDLSVGSILALTSVITCSLLASGTPVFLSLTMGLGSSILLGAINGVGVGYLRIPSFIMTLAMMSIARGTATVATSGYEITNLPASFKQLTSDTFLTVPSYIFISILVLIALDLALRFWKPLTSIYYIGLNEEASKLSGINTRLLLTLVYSVSGLLAGIAAIIVSSKSGMGYSGFGLSTELNAITAAVIGGASLNGGKGTILGACLGVLFLSMINNGFILAGINPNWQWFVNGAILILFLAMHRYSETYGK